MTISIGKIHYTFSQEKVTIWFYRWKSLAIIAGCKFRLLHVSTLIQVVHDTTLTSQINLFIYSPLDMLLVNTAH